VSSYRVDCGSSGGGTVNWCASTQCDAPSCLQQSFQQGVCFTIDGQPGGGPGGVQSAQITCPSSSGGGGGGGGGGVPATGGGGSGAATAGITAAAAVLVGAAAAAAAGVLPAH
jgi:hypothetical protein